MPRVSKRRLNSIVWGEINNTLFEVISSRNKKETGPFLKEFLTREEKTMLAKRLTLYLMILGEYPDLEIKEVLKVSLETIRIAKHSLASKSRGFKDNLKKWVRRSEKKKETNRLVKMIELALASKSDMKARAKLGSGDY